MSKTDRELAVNLACATIIATAIKSNIPKPIDGNLVDSILRDCYDSVTNLPENEECKQAL